MKDIHHFFTPLAENIIVDQHANWHLHPIITLATVKAVRDDYNLPHDTDTLNQVSAVLNRIGLDMMIANLRGRAKGRLYLTTVQNALAGKTPLDFTPELRHQVLTDAKLNPVDFDDFDEYAHATLNLELRLYREQGSQALPASLVINPYDHENYLYRNMTQAELSDQL
jgi:hypothetical protein